MEAVKKNGKAKSIGVSNFQQAHLPAILETATIPPSINHLIPPILTRSISRFIQHIKNIATAWYGLLAPLTKAKGGPIDEMLTYTKFAVSEAEIIFRWALDQDAVMITTSYKESSLRDYLRTLAFNLTQEKSKRSPEKAQRKGSEGSGGNSLKVSTPNNSYRLT